MACQVLKPAVSVLAMTCPLTALFIASLILLLPPFVQYEFHGNPVLSSGATTLSVDCHHV